MKKIEERNVQEDNTREVDEYPYTREQLEEFEIIHRNNLIELGFSEVVAVKIAQESIKPEIEELNAFELQAQP